MTYYHRVSVLICYHFQLAHIFLVFYALADQYSENNGTHLKLL